MYVFGFVAVNVYAFLCFSDVVPVCFRGFFANNSDVFIESRRYCSRG